MSYLKESMKGPWYEQDAEAAVQRWSYEKCSKNMQQIYRKIPITKCDFNNIVVLVNTVFPIKEVVKMLHC